jgi:hypothetical protein
MLYALPIASQKLCHYFQNHLVRIITSFPLETILWNQEATDHIVKWVVELASSN